MQVTNLSGTDQVQGHFQANTALGYSVATVAKCVLKDACTVFQIIGQNASAAAAYLQLFDSLTAPAAGVVPLAQAMVPAGTSTAIAQGSSPQMSVRLSNGCYLAWSTTPWTYTAASSGTGLNAEAWGV